MGTKVTSKGTVEEVAEYKSLCSDMRRLNRIMFKVRMDPFSSALAIPYFSKKSTILFFLILVFCVCVCELQSIAGVLCSRFPSNIFGKNVVDHSNRLTTG